MNQPSLELLSRIGERKDIMLAILLLAIVFMMVLPLPPLALDILIAINMTISVVLLMMAVYINSPLQFSAFPAVLLITTTDATLGEISAACGFYDQSSFTRQFRSVLGLTPGAYRSGR